MMNILGISCYYHDAAAALIKNGRVVAAAQEERFTRQKHDENFPKQAIDFCLNFNQLKARDLDAVAFYDKPLLKFERILVTHLTHFPRGLFAFEKAMHEWLTRKIWTKQLIKEELEGYEGPIYFPEHHLSHAASAFLVSSFKKAMILTMDGVGEWETAARGFGSGNQIYLTESINFPDSLGLLYSAFTYYLGFKVNSAEYKVMGLAPYGKPKYVKKIKDNLIEIKADGSFKMNMKYFAYPYGLRMTSSAFHQLFGGEPRPLGFAPTQREKDLAMSLQKVTEEIVTKSVKSLYNEYRLKQLCLAGGVALNCVANGEILRKTEVKDLFIQPAAGDAGGAVGAAMVVYYQLNPAKKRAWAWQDAYLGPEFSNRKIKEFLTNKKVKYQKLERNELLKRTAQLIKKQAVVGWFQGRMEFGPRALGNRSILADARNAKNQDRVNLKIKFRESFRPFAPTVLEPKMKQWFEIKVPSPYMLLIANVRIKKIPAVTHVDNSARIQSIRRKDNPLYYDLIKEFERLTGVPVIINTSFNQRGEPIVCTPADAFACFLRTDMDYLVMGNYVVSKKDVSQEMIDEARKVKFAGD